MRPSILTTLLTTLALAVSQTALAQSCPQPLAAATRLVLVTADSMHTPTATLQTFERAAPGESWRASGEPESALIGLKGMAWAPALRGVARPNEPRKAEGDTRLPAGFFPIGRSFGFAASPRPGYLQIGQGTVCVDDPSSPAYNTVTSRAKVGWRVHGENMWRIPQYRRGLLVDYPTDAKARAGSCIFVHVRLPGSKGTHGCVALPEARLETLQGFAQPGAVLAVLPREALGRFKGCVP